MLKKSSHIILAFLMLVSASGLTVNLHYCGDTFIDYGVFSEVKSCCTVAGEVNHSNETACTLSNPANHSCHNEIFKVDNLNNYIPSIQSNHSDLFSISLLFSLISTTFLFDFEPQFTLTTQTLADTSPPPISISKYLSILQTYLL